MKFVVKSFVPKGTDVVTYTISHKCGSSATRRMGSDVTAWMAEHRAAHRKFNQILKGDANASRS